MWLPAVCKATIGEAQGDRGGRCQGWPSHLSESGKTSVMNLSLVQLSKDKIEVVELGEINRKPWVHARIRGGK